jgi:uncharacterized protein (TIGR03437 family)
VQVTIGGSSARAVFARVVGAGLFQVNAIVPDLADGFHPVSITVNGSLSPAGVWIPVQKN